MAQGDLISARNGNPAAFERLVTPYLNGLFLYIKRRVGEMAEDTYQETLLAAWRAMPGFQEGSSVKTWLYAIAGYKCADVFRRKGREPSFTDLDQVNHGEGFEDSHLTTLTMQEALSKLGQEDQALLTLVYAQGFTQKEAASLMGIPEGTVKSRLQQVKNPVKRPDWRLGQWSLIRRWKCYPGTLQENWT